MTEDMKERLCRVEQDISEIKSDIAVIKNNIEHITQVFSGLCCKEHTEKIMCLEKKQERVVVAWATLSSAIILIGVIAGILVHIRGLL